MAKQEDGRSLGETLSLTEEWRRFLTVRDELLDKTGEELLTLLKRFDAWIQGQRLPFEGVDSVSGIVEFDEKTPPWNLNCDWSHYPWNPAVSIEYEPGLFLGLYYPQSLTDEDAKSIRVDEDTVGIHLAYGYNTNPSFSDNSFVGWTNVEPPLEDVLFCKIARYLPTRVFRYTSLVRPAIRDPFVRSTFALDKREPIKDDPILKATWAVNQLEHAKGISQVKTFKG